MGCLYSSAPPTRSGGDRGGAPTREYLRQAILEAIQRNAGRSTAHRRIVRDARVAQSDWPVDISGFL